MFDFLKSLFNTEKEELSEKTEKIEKSESNNIIPNILAKRGLQYVNIISGYQIKLKDDFYLIIPFTIDKNTYFYLQKGLKDSNENDVKCTYFFKIVEKDNKPNIIFVNRIKILNDNIKCDENYSRIKIEMLSDITNIINDIVNNIPKKVTVDVEEDKTNKYLPFVLGATTAAAAVGILMTSDNNNNMMMKGGGKKDEIEKEVDKYNNLKRLLEESLSE
jgi:hypothetical protein